MNKRYILVVILSLILGFNIIYISLSRTLPIVHAFTSDELIKYNGTNPSLPIYIALNGLVYDVSAGKDYYQTGGSYHYLAGRDSSSELNLIGGGIIKTKYPVIGQFQPQ